MRDKLLHMLVLDYAESSGTVYFDFDQMLHRGSSDVRFYKRNWASQPSEALTSLGRTVLKALMRDSIGLEYVEIRSFKLQAGELSRAVSGSVVIAAVREELEAAGYTLVDEPRSTVPPDERLRVTRHDHPTIVARVLWASIKRWWGHDVLGGGVGGYLYLAYSAMATFALLLGGVLKRVCQDAASIIGRRLRKLGKALGLKR